MKSLIFMLSFIIPALCMCQLTVTAVGSLPEAVSNNAVCEGYVNGTPYLFSFGGIDNSKIYSGIHLKSFRYNIETGESEQIADLPDDLGKIAMGASRIGNIVYIIGGYNVFSDDFEISSRKVHRYDINNNVFLEDAAQLPTATDDHVQAVWNDSLIYVVTGWSNNTNTASVQIYNPATNEWTIGDHVPFSDTYKSFGASGIIKNDEIVYFGGATSGQGFGIQNQIRRGAINPDNPTEITWSIETPDSQISGYRMAAMIVNNQPHWIGGSNNTYNYDGLAYDGSGGVSPNNRDLYFDGSEWLQSSLAELPMDLRGIAVINDTLAFIAGGMLDNQEITNKIYRLEWKSILNSTTNLLAADIIISPNPTQSLLQIIVEGDELKSVNCYSSDGQLHISKLLSGNKIDLDVSSLNSGIYYLEILTKKGNAKKTFMKS